MEKLIDYVKNYVIVTCLEEDVYVTYVFNGGSASVIVNETDDLEDAMMAHYFTVGFIYSKHPTKFFDVKKQETIDLQQFYFS